MSIVSLGSDEQLPRTIVDGAHRVGRVSKQVQYHLLQLHPIALDGRKIFRELGPKNHSISLKLTQRQRNHLSRSVVQVHGFHGRALVAKEQAQSCEHLRRLEGRRPASLDRCWRW